MKGMLILLLVVVLLGIVAALISWKKDRREFMFTGMAFSILSAVFLVSTLVSI